MKICISAVRSSPGPAVSTTLATCWRLTQLALLWFATRSVRPLRRRCKLLLLIRTSDAYILWYTYWGIIQERERDEHEHVLIEFYSAVWGAVLMFTALCHNHQGLWANRFFLGISEAAIAPGLAVVISMWYKRSEQPLRHAAWFLGNTFAGIVGGVLAYGIGRINTIDPWKVCLATPCACTTQKRKKKDLCTRYSRF